MCLLLNYLLAATAAAAAAAAATSCRDRRTWPFSSASIWNMPIGDGAVYNHANIYTLPPGPPPRKPANQCDAGKADPSTRSGCAGWRANWTSEDCLNHGCCYVAGPSPDPNGRVKCWRVTCNTHDRPAFCAAACVVATVSMAALVLFFFSFSLRWSNCFLHVLM